MPAPRHIGRKVELQQFRPSAPQKPRSQSPKKQRYESEVPNQAELEMLAGITDNFGGYGSDFVCLIC